jgi:hypothetical protein
MRDPKALKDYDKNAKKHPPEQIEKLASAFKAEGFHGLIQVWKGDIIICGHGRKYAAIKAGLTSVPCEDLSHLTEQQARSKRLGDNKLAESEWDLEVAAFELRELEGASYDWALTGFDAIPAPDLFQFKPPNEKDTSEAGFMLRVIFDTEDEQQELFLELRDRGFKVKV